MQRLTTAVLRLLQLLLAAVCIYLLVTPTTFVWRGAAFAITHRDAWTAIVVAEYVLISLGYCVWLGLDIRRWLMQPHTEPAEAVHGKVTLMNGAELHFTEGMDVCMSSQAAAFDGYEAE